MKRRIFNILAAISLVLCLAMAGLWVRSYWWCEILKYTSPVTAASQQTDWEIVSFPVVLAFGYQVGHYGPPSPLRPQHPGWAVEGFLPPPRAPTIRSLGRGGFEFLGFGCGHGKGGSMPDWGCIFFPDWFLCLLFALAPVRWLILKRREIRDRPRHLCKTCGYDLRATPELNGPLLERCPECGAEACASVPNR